MKSTVSVIHEVIVAATRLHKERNDLYAQTQTLTAKNSTTHLFCKPTKTEIGASECSHLIYGL